MGGQGGSGGDTLEDKCEEIDERISPGTPRLLKIMGRMVPGDLAPILSDGTAD